MKNMPRWTVESIPWERVNSANSDPDILMLVKTASLVEYNSADYTAYLSQVFHGDPEFIDLVQVWDAEERQHGLALKKWAEIIDPSFHFEDALARFRKYFRLQLDATTSIRGSLARELVSRCVVETGTTSYYSALRDATPCPVLKQICHQISIDEIHHFNLFYGALERYASREKLRWWSRARVIYDRVVEVDDEELSFAFAAANYSELDPARLPEYARSYLRRGLKVYRAEHFKKALGLLSRAGGVKLPRTVQSFASRLAYRGVQRRVKRLENATV
jgi:hypothetical protein